MGNNYDFDATIMLSGGEPETVVQVISNHRTAIYSSNPHFEPTAYARREQSRSLSIVLSVESPSAHIGGG